MDTQGARILQTRIALGGKVGARAERVSTAYGEPHAPLTESADAAVLRASGQGGDVAFCARESVLAVAPRVTAASDGVAVVSDPASSTPCRAPQLCETDEPIFMERA